MVSTCSLAGKNSEYFVETLTERCICVVTATIVAKEAANGSEEGVQDSVCQALFVGAFIALIGTTVIFTQSERMLGAVLKGKTHSQKNLIIICLLESSLIILQFESWCTGTRVCVTLPHDTSICFSAFNNLIDRLFFFSR